MEIFIPKIRDFAEDVVVGTQLVISIYPRSDSRGVVPFHLWGDGRPAHIAASVSPTHPRSGPFKVRNPEPPLRLEAKPSSIMIDDITEIF